MSAALQLDRPSVITPPALVFDEAAHTYTVLGRQLDSVTTLLKRLTDFSGIPPDVLERKRQIGQAVAAATDMLDKGVEIDPASLDPAILGYVQAYQSFLSEQGWTVIASEWRGYYPATYAGTLDRIFQLPNGARSVTDLKCTVEIPPSVGPQTAAYKRIWNHWNPALLATKRHALQLKPDGKYRLQECTDPDDLNIFLNELTLKTWRERHGC